MRNKFVIPLLFLTLIAVAGWGYSQYQAKRQWEISTENQYQRAFEELATHINNLETNMSKALVASSFPQTIRLLSDCWREANSCQEDLGQLPLTSIDLSRTKMLLAKAGTFCFKTAQDRLVKGTDMNEKDWQILQGLRNQTRMVSQHLVDLQQKFYSERTRWLEVDRLGTIGATDLANGLNNNKVAKAFLMLEDGLKRVPDIQFEGNNLDFVPKPTGLTGKNISPQEAVDKCRSFLGPEYKNADIKNERVIKGGFPSYMLSVSVPGKPNKDLRCSVSVKGGHVAWFLGNRDVQNPRLNINQCTSKAEQFLERNGYTNMKPISQESFANITTCTFAPEKNGVLRYPEFIKVQVAQDNGDILGCDTIAYLTFNEPNRNQASKPKYSPAQIKQMLNPHFKSESIQLAEVLDEMYNKVLCYQVNGTQGKDRYQIFYNCNNGQEEKIRRVDQYGNEIL